MSLLIKALRQAEREHSRQILADTDTTVSEPDLDEQVDTAAMTYPPVDAGLTDSPVDRRAKDDGLMTLPGFPDTGIDEGVRDPSEMTGTPAKRTDSGREPASLAIDRDPVVHEGRSQFASRADELSIAPQGNAAIPRHRSESDEAAGSRLHGSSLDNAANQSADQPFPTERAQAMKLRPYKARSRYLLPSIGGLIGIVIGMILWWQFHAIDGMDTLAHRPTITPIEANIDSFGTADTSTASDTPAASATPVERIDVAVTTEAIAAGDAGALSPATTKTLSAGNRQADAVSSVSPGPTAAQVIARTPPATNPRAGAAPTAGPIRRTGAVPAGPRSAPALPPIRFQRTDESLKQKRTLVNKGWSALRARDYEQADIAYKAALAIDRNLIDAWVGLAASAAHQGQVGQAEQHYQRALAIDPNDSIARTGLIALRGESAVSDSESALRSLLEASRPNATGHQSLGNALAAQGRWAEAQQAYFDAASLQPDDPDLTYNLAVALEHIRQPRAALEHYERALELAATRGSRFDPAAARARVSLLRAR